MKDLVACDFTAIPMLPDTMASVCDGRPVSLVPVNVQVDTIASAKSSVHAGLGLQHSPHGEVEEEIASGRVVRVMPQLSLPGLGVYAVWPDVGPQKILTRLLIDFLVDNKASLV